MPVLQLKVCTNVTVRNLIFLLLYSWVVRWSAVHWLLVIFCVRAHLHIREIRSELFCHQFTCLQVCSSLSLKLYSISYLQSYSPTQEVQIKIWILALFFNQRYELGPKAVIPTCSQVVSIMLSGELSNSSDTSFCVVLKALR